MNFNMQSILCESFLAFLLYSIWKTLSVSAESACSKIEFVSRKEWKAPSTVNHSTIDLPVKHVFIHHTEMSFCHNLDECSKEMRTIYELHTTPPRLWGDIGYNFLIGGDSRVYIGRNWNAAGRHTLGMNTESVAFSLMGNYDKFLPNDTILEVTHGMIECGIEKGIISKDYQLHGHRDQSCTTCPGDALYHHIRKWSHYVGGPLDTYACNSP